MVLAEVPGILTVDLLSKPPKVVSNVFNTQKIPSSVTLPNHLPFAIVPNYGEENNWGNTLDIFTLDNDGMVVNYFSSLTIGNSTTSKPYQVAMYENLDENTSFAFVSFRHNPDNFEIAYVDFSDCLGLLFPGCAQVTNLHEGSNGTTGLAIHPQGEFGMFSKYDVDKVFIFETQFSGNSLSANGYNLDSRFGSRHYGPIDIEINPTGTRGFVLNHLDPSLVVFDLSQGPNVPNPWRIALTGELPERMALSRQGLKVWVTFSGSNELKTITFENDDFTISPSLGLMGLNNPGGIAIQP